jgi:large subunit ribosomal protein L21e
MRGSKGYYTGTRSLLRKPTREKGKPNIGKILQDYTPGSQVIIKMDSSIQKSMPHKRFHGKIGVIVEKRGRGRRQRSPGMPSKKSLPAQNI